MAKKSAPQKKTPAAKTAPSKSKGPKKKAASKPAAAKSAAASNGPVTGACYVAVTQVAVSISRAKGKAGGTACDDFETAKNAAIDGLIESIEAAESRLAACKRASTVEELTSF